MKSTTEQDYRERMYCVLEHIQGHLDQALSLEELAAVSHFSAFHFHRIFKGMVGEPVHQYIKRLRLERAAVQLKLTNRPVRQIAFDAGYETHEAFSRAFKTKFRYSPTGYREQYRIQENADVSTPLAETAPELSVLQTGESEYVVQVAIKRIERVHVAYVRHVGNYGEVGEAYGKLVSWMMRSGQTGGGLQAIGLPYDDPDVTAPESLRYDACVVVGEEIRGEGEIGLKDIGGQRCAVTVHRGPYDRLGETYQHLLGSWFPRSGHEPAPSPSYEFYLNDPMTTSPEELLTEVCVPLLDS